MHDIYTVSSFIRRVPGVFLVLLHVSNLWSDPCLSNKRPISLLSRCTYTQLSTTRAVQSLLLTPGFRDEVPKYIQIVYNLFEHRYLIDEHPISSWPPPGISWFPDRYREYRRPLLSLRTRDESLELSTWYAASASISVCPSSVRYLLNLTARHDLPLTRAA
jgi:hypothetical protein